MSTPLPPIQLAFRVRACNIHPHVFGPDCLYTASTTVVGVKQTSIVVAYRATALQRDQQRPFTLSKRLTRRVENNAPSYTAQASRGGEHFVLPRLKTNTAMRALLP